MKYRVNEQFNTVQGEGRWTGVPASFIRLQICTVGCSWCDTKYTWAKGGELMEVEEIISSVQFRHVVITGGEPTVWNLDPLIVGLKNKGHFVQMETSGQNDYKGQFRPDWVTWSPKPNLGFKASPTVLQSLCEVKFVVDKDMTLEVIWDCLKPVFEQYKDYPYWPEISLMPEGCPPSDESMAKALTYTQAMSETTDRPVRLADRLQYRLGVK